MPFRVPDDEENDVESAVHPLSPPTRTPMMTVRSLDVGPGHGMPSRSPYSNTGEQPSSTLAEAGATTSLQPRTQSLPTTSRTISAQDEEEQDNDEEHEGGPSEVPWLETVEEVLKRIRKRHAFRRYNISSRNNGRKPKREQQQQRQQPQGQPEDGLSSNGVKDDEDDGPQPNALEVSLHALRATARALLEYKNSEDEDGEDRKEFGFPSLQPLDVQIVPEEKTLHETPSTPISVPGAHRVPGPSVEASNKSRTRTVAVAVDWTNQLPPPPPFLGQTNEYEVIHPQNTNAESGGGGGVEVEFGSPMSDFAIQSPSSRQFQHQPTQQDEGRRPHGVYVPSSSSLSSQMAVESSSVKSHRPNATSHHGARTLGVVPPLANGSSHRFRNTSLVAPSFFGFPLQRRTTPHSIFAHRLQSLNHAAADHPLEATVVRDDMNFTQAEPVLTTRSSPARRSRQNGNRNCHDQRQWQQSRQSSSRGRQLSSSSSEDTDMILQSTGSSKSRRMLLLFTIACLTILIVIVLVLAMLLYHRSSSSSQNAHLGSPGPTTNGTASSAYSWQPIYDCGQILGTSVALSSDGSLLAAAGSAAVNATTSASFVNAYLMNGKQCVQLGDTIQSGVASIHSLPVPPLALSGDGYTLAVGTTSANNTGGGIAMYKFNNSSWSKWGEAITAWTSANSSGGIWGWSVAMASNGLRLASAVIEQSGPTRKGRGSVQVFQYNIEERQWGRMGLTFESDSKDDLSAFSVHLSADGKTLVVGAMSKSLDGASGNLRVQVNQWNQTSWYQMGASFSGAYDLITSGGDPVALSSDGHILAHTMDGHVQVFRYNGTDWDPLGNAIYEGGLSSTLSGVSLSFGDSGRRLAIGLPQAGAAGTVEIFQYDDNQADWMSIGNLSTAPFGDDYFGTRLALNVDNGSILAAGSENSAGDGSGHVLLYSSQQQGYA